LLDHRVRGRNLAVEHLFRKEEHESPVARTQHPLAVHPDGIRCLGVILGQRHEVSPVGHDRYRVRLGLD
jgi:hypothetical protein